eukprot:scaffold19116_cov76-Phaeocystis_antarctica.AAC.3
MLSGAMLSTVLILSGAYVGLSIRSYSRVLLPQVSNIWYSTVPVRPAHTHDLSASTSATSRRVVECSGPSMTFSELRSLRI